MGFKGGQDEAKAVKRGRAMAWKNCGREGVMTMGGKGEMAAVKVVQIICAGDCL